jgi:hypothetical protein
MLKKRDDEITGVFRTQLEQASARQSSAARRIRRIIDPAGGRTVLIVDGNADRGRVAGERMLSGDEGAGAGWSFDRYLVAQGIDDASRMLARRSELQIEGIAVESSLADALSRQLGPEWRGKVTIFGEQRKG